MALERTFGRDGTSGILVTEYENGSVRLEYTDYNVDFFGGADFEVWYTIDKENAEKFRSVLNEKDPAHAGDLQSQAEAVFGENFNETVFWDFCAEHGIKAERGSWTSFHFEDFEEFK